MRYIKVTFSLCLLLTLAGLMWYSSVMTADGGKPAPTPWLVADGGKPAPTPWLVADGGKPAPTPWLVADGGKPAPTPWLGIAS
jgi:hypothetical protein